LKITASTLAATGFFPAEVQAACLENLAAASEWVELKAGEEILGPKVRTDFLFIGTSGSATEEIRNHHTKQQSPYRTIGPGEFIGLFNDAKSISIRACSDWRGIAFPKSAFFYLASCYSSLQHQLNDHCVRDNRKIYVAKWLRNIFGQFSQAQFDEAEKHVIWKTLEAGQELKGGEEYYSMVHGRLNLVGKDGAVISELAPGQVIYRVRLLAYHEGSQIIAQRDCLLAGISCKSHFEFCQSSPEYLRAFLQDLELPTRIEDRSNIVNGRTVALIPHRSKAETEKFAAAALARLGSNNQILILDKEKVSNQTGIIDFDQIDAAIAGRIAWWIDSLERKYRHVIFLADPEPTPWTRLCIRASDQLVVVANASSDPTLLEVERELLKGVAADRRSLVLTYDQPDAEPKNTKKWLAERDGLFHFHVRLPVAQDVDRVIRFFTGQAVALVLSGGAGRGYTHLGVLRAMHELGIPVDIIGGASAGACIAAAHAVGWDHEKSLKILPPKMKKAFSMPALNPLKSILNTKYYDQTVGEIVPEIDIEDLRIPFFSVATKLKKAEPYVFRRGPLKTAVASSGRVPGLLTPLKYQDDYLVDGGMLDNLPLDAVRNISKYCAIIAVDIAGPVVENGTGTAADDQNTQLDLTSVLRRIAVLGSLRHIQSALRRTNTDLYMTPPVEQISMINFGHRNAQRAEQLGYEHCKPILQNWWQKKTAARAQVPHH
jgi:predicted acylesterase/phospholipase RssA/CRP-like cAMP-binding protein